MPNTSASSHGRSGALASVSRHDWTALRVQRSRLPPRLAAAVSNQLRRAGSKAVGASGVRPRAAQAAQAERKWASLIARSTVRAFFR